MRDLLAPEQEDELVSSMDMTGHEKVDNCTRHEDVTKEEGGHVCCNNHSLSMNDVSLDANLLL